MAGLAAAHELIERGFRVTVYEPEFLGGKARSIPVPGTGAGGRRDLPGEHGFRFFPGTYQHVPETMSRIPTARGGNVLDDHLVVVRDLVLAFDDPGYAPVIVPGALSSFAVADDPLVTVRNFQNAVATGLKLGVDIPAEEMTFFLSRLAVMATSCQERRIGQWENQSWLEFIRAEGKSPAYRRYLAQALVRVTVAAKSELASARTIGQTAVALLTAQTGAIPQYRSNLITGGVDRVLNRPTNEAWIDPWVAYLSARGVEFVLGRGLGGFEIRSGRIESARLTGGDAAVADWYVAALPVDRLMPLLDAPLLRAAPTLEGLRHLREDWMVGIQYYLARPSELPAAHIAVAGSPWAVTGIFQSRSWEADIAAEYGDGRVRECLSVDISEWDAPGALFGKTAKQCTREEIAREVWAQLRDGLNRSGAPIIRDEDLLGWHLDPGITWGAAGIANATPLLVNVAGTYRHRPDAATEIPNLFLCGDHLRTNIDLATMEGANEAGRRAANAILDAAGDSGSRAAIFPLWELPAFDALKDLDRERYRAGQPHLMES
ncbi:FAD-dependent oxidoreductase [Nocardia panacis]|uniref:FAD-dependent oxidoreductase n=2 Tax=Nocardia panacis TaxID=2340916 RepID=A0A3A4KGD2_9NOCA|nr:FAD-dependent oxidoreductase [Nocardia panacis]